MDDSERGRVERHLNHEDGLISSCHGPARPVQNRIDGDTGSGQPSDRERAVHLRARNTRMQNGHRPLVIAPYHAVPS